MSGDIRFDGKVVVITGAGNGLGREYALYFGKRGAIVVVNDLGGDTSGSGNSSKSADLVVQEIKSDGGLAVANYDSVEFGDKIIKTAIDNFGRVDVVINNAGILRDVSFQKMNQNDWDLIVKVHLNGTMSVSKAAWNYMRNQSYGRIINTSSSSGLFGTFGQANYSAAKAGIHGLTLALAKEGQKKNVFVNTICPLAASRLTKDIMPIDVFNALKPEYVVPLVGYLAHESCQETGSVFECGGGWISQLRWQRAQGAQFDLPFTAEQVREKWGQVKDFSKQNDYPTGGVDTYTRVQENLDRIEEKQKLKPKL